MRLQLIHITGMAHPGFAWKRSGETAEIWYWDEAPGKSVCHAFGMAEGVRLQPYPETVLRGDLPDGLHLLSCLSGVEAVSVSNGKINTARWFAYPPNQTQWAAFVRDAGGNIDLHPLPLERQPPSRARVDRAWRVHTTLIHTGDWRKSGAYIAVLGLIIGVTSAAVYDLKLNYLIDRHRSEYAELSKENGHVLQLQRGISQSAEFLDAVVATRPRVAQLRVLQALLDTGLFADQTQIGLVEWEFRGQRLRLLFSVPTQDFSLGVFLSTLERSGAFKDIRLVSGTAAGKVGITAEVAPLQSPVQGDALVAPLGGGESTERPQDAATPPVTAPDGSTSKKVGA